MSPIQKAQKIHAMKSQNRRQVLHSFMLQAMIAIACSFVFSTFSSSSSSFSIKHLSLTSLPQIWSSMFNPKCLFVIVNVIVVFLVGESKIGTTKSCPADNIYKEYVERSKSQRNASSPRREKKMKEEVAALATSSGTEQVYEECMEIKPSINDEIDALATTKVQATDKPIGRDMVIVNKKASRGKEILKQGDNCGRALLGAEELNKRAEDFIARVNKQRRLEQYSVL